jgi:branched-chain amino acid aminotransferase
MSRVVWLDGALIDPASASLSIDDPGVRYGEGLFETMRGHDGVIPLLERHLERLQRSIAALGLDGMPAIAQVREASAFVAAKLGTGAARIRVTVTPHPTVLVEGAPAAIDPQATLTAASIRGAWQPERRIAEHKTLSFLGWRDAQRQAQALGAGIALLLDAGGRLGEASTANVFCIIDGEIITAPISGILPGITRAVVMEAAPVREAILDEPAWRAADEMFVTSAVRGVVPVIRCDGSDIGRGTRSLGRELQRQVDLVLRGGETAVRFPSAPQ